nr:hypothetical protein [uncultured Clostridium sp.]
MKCKYGICRSVCFQCQKTGIHFWRSPVLVYDAAMAAEQQLCTGRFLQYSFRSHFLRDGESKKAFRAAGNRIRNQA